MFCPRCGAENLDNQTNCARCGDPLVVPSRPPRPKNHMAWSVISTVLCCLIGGIVAIVYSSQVDNKYYAGDYAGAEQASQTAKNWNIASMIIGGLINIVYMIAVIVGTVNGD